MKDYKPNDWHIDSAHQETPTCLKVVIAAESEGVRNISGDFSRIIIADFYGKEAEQHAHLVSAAPDLLAALIPFAETPTTSETPGLACKDIEGDQLIFAARVAVAKARSVE